MIEFFFSVSGYSYHAPCHIRLRLFMEIRTTLTARIDELAPSKDWEKKNRLLVYRGLLALCDRDFNTASGYLVQCLPTFTPCDIITFKDYVFYTIVATVVSQDRAVLKTKILESPEILTLARETPSQYELVSAICECRYGEFFEHFVEYLNAVRVNEMIKQHTAYITRSVRLLVYKQFLMAYKSVTIATMADSFRVTSEFMENDLSVFIAIGKLTCKIDRINHRVESNRLEDPRNHIYSSIIKQGDALLNRIQRLSKVIDV